MERLTKRDKTYYDLYDEEITDGSIGNWYDKLSMLEDIEGELGCPLVVLFRAIRDGIYTSISRTSDTMTHFYVAADDDTLQATLVDLTDYWYIRDYKKTWWLREDKSE